MEEDALKKIIQSIQLDDPGIPFTDGIMEIIETREELKLSPAMLAVLKTELITEPPVHFTEDLMESIQPAPNKISSPIISRKTGLIVTGIAASVLIWVLFNFHAPVNHLPNNLYFKKPVLDLAVTTSGITKFAGSFFTYLIPLSILLIADYYFRTGRRQSIAGNKMAG